MAAADVKTVLAWANELCAQALTEARAGDPSLANRLGANSSLKLFFDNVHGLKSVKADQFPAYYTGHFKEIARLHEDYLRDEQQAAAAQRVESLEAQMVELKALVIAQAAELATLTESRKPDVKPAKKPAKGEGDAESEA